MKEHYISPVLQITCFAPVERLAATINFDDLLDLTDGGKGDATNPSGGDVGINLNLG